jgi:hypothetical protein
MLFRFFTWYLAMARCECGASLAFCGACSRPVAAGDSLLKTVGDFEVAVGPSAGKMVRDVAIGDELLKQARRGAKGPAHARLLRAYARAVMAHRDLLQAAQSAHVFSDTSGRGISGGTGEAFQGEYGGTGEAGDPPRWRCPFSCPRLPGWKSMKLMQRIGVVKSYVQWMFPIHIWIKAVAPKHAVTLISLVPLSGIVVVAVICAPRVFGMILAQGLFWMLTGFIEGVAYLASSSADSVANHFSEYVASMEANVNAQAETLFGENGDVVLESMSTNVPPCLLTVFLFMLGRYGNFADPGPAGGVGAGAVVAA